MRRGTTPTHTFISDMDLTGVEVLYITYKQSSAGCSGDVSVEKTLADVTVTPEAIETTLTQEETLQFDENGRVDIQIRARFPDETAVVSNIISCPAKRILKEGVI